MRDPEMSVNKIQDHLIELPCPLDGYETEQEPECPTYPSSKYGWMRCTPVCGNATRHFCTNPNCYWEYLEGVSWENPNYAQYLQTNGPKPVWLS